MVYPELTSIASLLVGGTMKQMDGTVASFPVEFRTVQLYGWELFTRAHSSPLCTVIWAKQNEGLLNKCEVITLIRIALCF